MSERGVRAARILLACAVLLAAAAADASAASSAAPRTIRVGYYDARPSCYRDESGQPRGVFIDILDDIAPLEGWRLEYRFGAWDDLLAWLKDGSVDLVPAIVSTHQREAFAVFTEESVMSDWGEVFSRPGKGLASILDLDGKEVGGLENDFWLSGPEALEELCGSFGIHPRYRHYSDYPSLFKALAKGQIDAAVGSNSLGMAMSAKLPIVATSIVFSPIELRFAASRMGGAGAALASSLDAALKAMRDTRPDAFSAALARYAIAPRRELRVPPWLSILLAAVSLILVAACALLVIQRRALSVSQRRLISLVDDSPMPLWEEDFSAVKRRLDAARASGVSDWAAYFSPPERVAEFASLVGVKDVNRAALQVLGYSSKDELRGKLSKILGEEAIDPLRSEFVALAEGRGFYEGEAPHLGAHGERRLLHLRLSLVPGFEGDWKRVLISAADMTERAAAEKALLDSLAEKQTLLQEVHHRVKNNLQVVCSLVALQLGSVERDSPMANALADMEARVRAMSFVHEILYQSDTFASVDFASYISSLCSYLFDAYSVDRRRVQLSLEVEDVRLSLDKAIPCGLLVNELVVNSLKHAFPGDREGTISIKMARESRSAVCLSVQDDGVGASPTELESAAPRSIGVSLVRSLAKQLGGECRIEGPPGLKAGLSFPA